MLSKSLKIKTQKFLVFFLVERTYLRTILRATIRRLECLVKRNSRHTRRNFNVFNILASFAKVLNLGIRRRKYGRRAKTSTMFNISFKNLEVSTLKIALRMSSRTNQMFIESSMVDHILEFGRNTGNVSIEAVMMDAHTMINEIIPKLQAKDDVPGSSTRSRKRNRSG